MKDLRILHITDLHIDNITSVKENLRTAFYKEFIDGLMTKIAATQGGKKIDLIICTGDFVNKGKTENFVHAETVLNYIISKTNLTTADTAVCIGNHDILTALDKIGNNTGARENFTKLENVFHASEILINRDTHKIFRNPNLDIYFLTFDSTLGANGSNLPSILSDEKIDEIIVDVDSLVHQEKLLIVLSHYPMILFNRSQAIVDSENWVENHFWKSGFNIVERCYKKRKGSLTLWFFGDGHLPDFWSYNDFHHFFMTGMIGGNYINPIYKDPKSGNVVPFNKTNEAKVIFVSSSNDIKINTYSYRSKGYVYSPHTGSWEHTLSEIRLVDNPFEKISLPEYPDEAGQPSASRSIDTITNLISTSVQEEIISQIRERKLYSFNRYATSSSEVSLGWVSITKLFENRELLSRCIDKTVFWLNNLKNINLVSEDSIFIGIDFWGAIFASQASMMKNIDNYCIATKSKSQHNILLEKPEFLGYKIQSRSSSLKSIVLFTDVISTGNTVLSIKEKISNYLGNSDNVNWVALSIISDMNQTRKVELNNFTALGSLCTSLRIPILKIDELPDEGILPVKYDIR